MRKNISNLLQKGNLTPKERYLLLIQADVIEATTNKKTLTEADKEALTSWQAKTSNEAREWNRYNEGWKLSGRAGLEAEMIYWQTRTDHYRKNIIDMDLQFYPYYREQLNALQTLKKIKVVDIKEAVEITNKQREQQLKGGVDFDYAIYQLAFESLSDDLKKDLKTLYDEVEYDTEYLDSEEIIANLFNGKDTLTEKAKEKIAELVAERGYNKFAKEYQFYHYFADIPIMEIAKRWVKEKGIKLSQKQYDRLEKIKAGLREKIEKAKKDKETQETALKVEKNLKERDKSSGENWLLEDNIEEILEYYARDNKITVKDIIKEACLRWLDEGLLISDYSPIFNDEGKDTYNGDTKHTHSKIFKEWLKAKDKARETLKSLITKGDLKTADKTGQDKIITGDSLYNFKSDYKFVKDFKERVDKYQPNLGLVYADDDPKQKGDHLDRELLIADKDKDGKPAVISMFGMSIKKIEAQFNRNFFTETKKDGETYLEFKSDEVEKVFKEIREDLIKSYARLLAFSKVFKRLSKTYEAEIDYALKERVKNVSDFIDQHNEHLENALEDTRGFGVGFGLYKKPLKTKDDLFINRDGILPDTEILTSWTQKFEDILGDDF